MKTCPMYQNYETSDYGGYEFDPQVDFVQFLAEARQHAREVSLHSSLPISEEVATREMGEGKRTKKSWKHSLFKWWKAEKKSKPEMEPEKSSRISNPRKGHVSGPVYGSGAGADIRHHRQASGPLANVFSHSKRVKADIPYVSLDQNSDPLAVKAYGPVYLVT